MCARLLLRLQIGEGDVLVLGTDGLWDNLGDEDIQEEAVFALSKASSSPWVPLKASGTLALLLSLILLLFLSAFLSFLLLLRSHPQNRGAPWLARQLVARA